MISKDSHITQKQFPVLITMYHRPDNVKRLVEALRKEKPKKIYVSSDGPLTYQHRDLVQQCRNEIVKIDWPCDLVKLYRSENAGLYACFSESLDVALAENDGIVVLEDDCIPEDNFFDYLRYVEAIHGDDSSVPIFCGHNPIGKTPLIGSDSAPYSLSKRFRVWGFYIKAEFWREIRSLPFISPMPISVCIRDSLRVPGIFSKLLKLRMLLILRKKIGFGDIYIDHFLAKRNLLVSIPNKNLVENIGDGDRATHTKHLPNLRFAIDAPDDFESKPRIKAKLLRRVEILDGWLLLIWATRLWLLGRR